MREEELRKLLAEELLNFEVDQRIPTVRELSNKYGSSVGSIQAVFNSFEDEKIIDVERKGHLGSFLKSFSVVRLWEIINSGKPLVVSLPLPTTAICEGLATAIKAELMRAGLDVFLTFLRGSKRRIRALRQGQCDLIVISKFAAEMNKLEDEEVFLELPHQTYVLEHRLYYKTSPHPTKDKPYRVIMDTDSIDLQMLTEIEFDGMDVEYVQSNFMSIPKLLTSGEADAAIWDIDEAESKLPDSIKSRPMSAHVMERIKRTPYIATFVGSKKNHAAKVLINKVINIDNLIDIQKEVLNRIRIPEY